MALVNYPQLGRIEDVLKSSGALMKKSRAIFHTLFCGRHRADCRSLLSKARHRSDVRFQV